MYEAPGEAGDDPIIVSKAGLWCGFPAAGLSAAQGGFSE